MGGASRVQTAEGNAAGRSMCYGNEARGRIVQLEMGRYPIGINEDPPRTCAALAIGQFQDD